MSDETIDPILAGTTALAGITARNICVIKPSAFGDVVQSLPILRALRQRFPDARISWLINQGLDSLLVGHPHIDHVIPYQRRGSWSDWGTTLRDLRRRQFDLVIDLQGLLRTGVMTLATGAKWRVGLETAREGSRFSHNLTIPHSGRDVPAHARYWRVAEAFGAGALPREADIAVDPADTAWAERQLRSLPSPILAVNPGARWVTKRWPIESFAAVTRRAVEELGLSVALVGGADERTLTDVVSAVLTEAGHARQVVNLAGMTTLKQLAAVAQQARFLLTNDSGPMHLAAAMGTPVVGLFLCTSPERSGPPGSQHELIRTNVACAASYKKQCPQSGSKHMCCMANMDVEQVWQAVQRMERRVLSETAA